MSSRASRGRDTWGGLKQDGCNVGSIHDNDLNGNAKLQFHEMPCRGGARHQLW